MTTSASGLLALVASGSALAQDLVSPLYLNHDHARYSRERPAVQYQHALTRAAGGLLFAWVAYDRGSERVLATRLQGGRMTRVEQLTAGSGTYFGPVVAGGQYAAWSRFADGRWSVAGRNYTDGWSPIHTLSDPAADSTRPAAVAAGRIMTAWEESRDGSTRIVGSWQESGRRAEISSGARCFRPALATMEGAVWAYWDCYADGRYRVFARQLAPELGPAEALPAGDASAFKATALGNLAVWIERREVAGANGVLDQHYSIHGARRVNGRWVAMRDLADLRHGLLPRIVPSVQGLSGYQGRRLHPMLASGGGSTWLLWERKKTHNGGTETAGELCGRRFDGQQWGEPVSLHEGQIDYQVEPGIRAGRLTVVAAGMLQDHRVFEVDLARGQPLARGEWPGWEPVTLPRAPRGPRPSTEIAGRRHHLYWADLHVHTGLTPDAEGEPDELLHFARDAVQLDAVVLQENDFYARMLTEGEYRMGLHWSKHFSKPGEFIALPGYEWTHRQDDNRPNHRTVIWPGYDAPIVRHAENNANFTELCDVVAAAGGLMHTQHEVYRWSGRECDANIEVASGWRLFIKDPAKIHEDLSARARAGFVATSDGHRRNPGTGGGLTGIWASELTHAALMEALRDHRVFATNGSRVVIDARANGAFMGRLSSARDEVRLELKASAPKRIRRAVLIRDGAETRVVEGASNELTASHTDRPGRGYHWYYWRVELEGESPDLPGNIKIAEGHLAWSSPHRVSVD
jgi:hypothetical protein